MNVKAFSLIAALALLGACNEHTNPIENAHSVGVFVTRGTLLGDVLEAQYGEASVEWCLGKSASRCSHKLASVITDPNKVEYLSEFVNKRLTGWGIPLFGPRIPRVKTIFYDFEGEIVGTIGLGFNFFSRAQMSKLTRGARRKELDEFLKAIQIERSDLSWVP